jgi:hypothetical protein
MAHSLPIFGYVTKNNANNTQLPSMPWQIIMDTQFAYK